MTRWRGGDRAPEEKSVNQISGGERQLVHVARAIAQDTPVLLCDEPTSALDLKHQVRVLNLQGTGTGRKTVVVVLHDLTLAARYCDRLVLMAERNVAATGPPEAVLSPELVSEVYGVPVDIRPDPVTESLRVTPL